MDRGAWLAGYSLWGCKESDTTEHAHTISTSLPVIHSFFNMFIPQTVIKHISQTMF